MENGSAEKQNREVFRTRFSVVLVMILAGSLFLVVRSYIRSPELELIIPLVIFFVIILILGGINYVIEDDQLIFRMWSFVNGKLDIHSIIKIERTYFVLASNAGSLKRLFGKTKKGSKIPLFLISPHNEKRFLERLKQINPGIEIKVEDKKGFYRFWDWDI
jgi:hypothetical protein